ncbi:aspartate aminotransferase, cytoplasmic-like [Bombina bombina]|uniref:aspartate aminotransferase, cytoplasmic-like n=1 Tax=Bombina bombina TaxID=8345 RepID=UPI00235A925D|nr:aspartate aminotransferase, cytoplasmic-like [Bombina bombina]
MMFRPPCTKEPTVCMSDYGHLWIPSPVEKIYLQIINDPTRNFEPLPVAGATEFNRSATEFIIGKDSLAIIENRACSIQTLGSTGALWIGADFLSRWYQSDHNKATVCIPSVAPGKHKWIFEDSGFTNICAYRFLDPKTKGLALPEMLEDLENAPDFSIIVLQASCNPTGIHIPKSVWVQIADIMKRKKMFPFFIMKAVGLNSGYVEKDAWSVRFFVSEGFELFCAQSFSANFGLYGERVGCLTVVIKTNEVLLGVCSQLEILARSKWSAPPAVGARIVATILNNSFFYAEWKESIKEAAKRLMIIREKMKGKLRLLGTLQSWEHITNQTGLFSYTGLTCVQVRLLIKKYHIYLHENGLINISSLNDSNLAYLLQSIHEVSSIPQ